MKSKTLNGIAITLVIIGICGVTNSDTVKLEGRIALIIGVSCLLLSIGLEIFIWRREKREKLV